MRSTIFIVVLSRSLSKPWEGTEPLYPLAMSQITSLLFLYKDGLWY